METKFKHAPEHSAARIITLICLVLRHPESFAGRERHTTWSGLTSLSVNLLQP